MAKSAKKSRATRLDERLRRRHRKQASDVYGGQIDRTRKPVALRRLSDDLGRIYRLTGDPIFKIVLAVLAESGLSQGGKRAALRYRGGATLEFEIALRAMERLIEARLPGKRPVSILKAAKIAAVKYGVGTNFDDGVKRLRTAYPSREKYFSRPSASSLSRRLLVIPVPGEFNGPGKLPKNGKVVADSPMWRLQMYTGRVTVRFLPKF